MKEEKNSMTYKFLEKVFVEKVGYGYAIGIDGKGNLLVSLYDILPDSGIINTGKAPHKFFPIDQVKPDTRSTKK